MAPDPRIIIAAGNNADLYQAVFDGLGLRYRRSPDAFAAIDPPPPFYADVTLIAPLDALAIAASLSAVPARSDGKLVVKDSFCTLDPVPNGVQCLFKASWIWRAGRKQTLPSGWAPVASADQLAQWESAWKEAGSATPGRLFRDALLGNPALRFFARWRAGKIEAGCIANLSQDSIGLSNVFCRSGDPAVFSEAAAVACALDPAMPIVGYEQGVDLDAAIRAGFEVIGPLQVLVLKGDCLAALV